MEIGVLLLVVSLAKIWQLLFGDSKPEMHYDIWKDEIVYKRYLFYKFESLEKHGDEDAKAKAKTDDEVLAFNKLIDEKEAILDESFAEFERCIWKKELMLDANATARKEMELTRMET